MLWQNVHLIRGKVPGRTRSSQVLWGSERLIKERAKEPYKYAGTKGRSAARQRRSHQKNYQRGMKACYIIPLLWWLCMWHYLSDPTGRKKTGFYGNGEMEHWTLCSCDSQQKNATLHKGPETHWEPLFFFFKQYPNSQILSDSCLCSWAGIAQLPLHHYSVDWDPRCCSLTRPQATTQLSEPGECT